MTPFQKVTFLKRYKRFLADIEMDGQLITVHCPNSGSMKGLTPPGNPAWISLSQNPDRKLKYTLEIIEIEGTPIGINTHRTNQIVHNALKEKKIVELTSYSKIEREIVYGASRIDFLLTGEKYPTAYVEVKNVTLKNGEWALFPDAPTLRGTKHLADLINIKAQGHRAIMLYVIQRNDCKKFSIAKDIDPLYCKVLQKAISCGVEVLAYQCNVTPSHILLDKSIPIDLNFN
jgi:sugar fermentation stimulation protein A